MCVHIVGKRRESLHLKVTQLVDEPAGKAYIHAGSRSKRGPGEIGGGWLVVGLGHAASLFSMFLSAFSFLGEASSLYLMSWMKIQATFRDSWRHKVDVDIKVMSSFKIASPCG